MSQKFSEKMRRNSKVHPGGHNIAKKVHHDKLAQQLAVEMFAKDNDSDKSSELDPEEKVEAEVDTNALIAKTIAEGGLAAKKGSLAFVRSELKKKIVREVLAEVMPDIGAYDVTGTVEAISNAKKGRFYQVLKFLGFVKLTLHEIILTGSFNMLEKYIVEINEGTMPNPMLINQADEHGRIPLIMATKLKQKSFVQLMLHYKAQPDLLEESTGRSALFYSVMNETIEISQLLFDKGASVNMADHSCVTPLMIACKKYNLLVFGVSVVYYSMLRRFSQRLQTHRSIVQAASRSRCPGQQRLDTLSLWRLWQCRGLVEDHSGMGSPS